MSVEAFLRRAACLGLAVVIAFLSYRPATSMLAIAGSAHNPTDGTTPDNDGDEFDATPLENLPRPARNTQVEPTVQIVREIKTSSSTPAEQKTFLAVEQLGLRPGALHVPSDALLRIEAERAKPCYLRPFHSSALSSPHSPPA